MFNKVNLEDFWNDSEYARESYISNKAYSLCGEFGSQFMIDEWEYPPIGVAVCDCPSAGHDMRNLSSGRAVIIIFICYIG